ncbi:MAG: iron donor protein CyaY [Bryobacteraceae bacterium]
MLSDQDFKKSADEALTALSKALMAAGDDYGFEVDFNAGALTVEFDEPPAKFVVSPNSPVKQIWVSALSRSFKLDWDGVENAFVYTETGETLLQLLERVVGKQLGEDVNL